MLTPSLQFGSRQLGIRGVAHEVPRVAFPDQRFANIASVNDHGSDESQIFVDRSRAELDVAIQDKLFCSPPGLLCEWLHGLGAIHALEPHANSAEPGCHHDRVAILNVGNLPL